MRVDLNEDGDAIVSDTHFRERCEIRKWHDILCLRERLAHPRRGWKPNSNRSVTRRWMERLVRSWLVFGFRLELESDVAAEDIEVGTLVIVESVSDPIPSVLRYVVDG